MSIYELWVRVADGLVFGLGRFWSVLAVCFNRHFSLKTKYLTKKKISRHSSLQSIFFSFFRQMNCSESSSQPTKSKQRQKNCEPKVDLFAKPFKRLWPVRHPGLSGLEILNFEKPLFLISLHLDTNPSERSQFLLGNVYISLSFDLHTS